VRAKILVDIVNFLRKLDDDISVLRTREKRSIRSQRMNNENTDCSLIVNRIDPHFWVVLFKHDLEPSTDLVEIRLGKIAYEAPCVDSDKKLFSRDFILLLRTKLAEIAGSCSDPRKFPMSKKFPTLRNLFFDFAMAEKVGFTNTGEWLSNSQSYLGHFRRSIQIKKTANLVCLTQETMGWST